MSPDSSFILPHRGRLLFPASGSTSRLAAVLAAACAVMFVVASCAVPGTPVRQIAGGFSHPWGMAFLPNGNALVGDRDTARLREVSPSGAITQRGTVPGVVAGGEGGLLGLAVSPTYATDRFVYAYLTSATDNRVVRFTLGGTPSPTPIVTGIPKASTHNGGRIAFGPDRLLYIATGDAANRNNSQNLASLGGKILRVTATGAPAPGNPFANSRVFSYGHRNVQGLAWDVSGRLFATEFGQNTWDEVNRIVRGGNYGWPVVEGPSTDSRFRAPLTTWRPADASPSGLAFAGEALWVGALRGQRVWRLQVGDTGTVAARAEYYRGTYGRIRTVVVTPDAQALWIATDNGSNDRILRVPLSYS